MITAEKARILSDADSVLNREIGYALENISDEIKKYAYNGNKDITLEISDKPVVRTKVMEKLVQLGFDCEMIKIKSIDFILYKFGDETLDRLKVSW